MCTGFFLRSEALPFLTFVFRARVFALHPCSRSEEYRILGMPLSMVESAIATNYDVLDPRQIIGMTATSNPEGYDITSTTPP